MVQENIVITARFVDKMTGGLKTTRNTINQFGQTTKTVSKQFKRMGDGSRKLTKQITKTNRVVQSARIAHKGFAGVMGMNLVQWRQFNAMGGKFKTIGGRAASTFRTMTHGLRGFRMEMLGVMFFGMGLQRFFKGLLQPALQLTGVFELFSNVLAILFLPIALALLDWFLPIFDWLMNLSDATKLLIGKWVLFGLGMGVLLFLFGMFALGIGSLILAFAGLFLVIDKLIPDVRIAGVSISGFVEAGLGITIVTNAFKFLRTTLGSLLTKFLELDFVKETIKKLGLELDKNKTPWENLKTIAIEVIDKIKEKLGLLTGETGESPFTTIQDMIDDVKETFGTWIQDLTTSIEDLTPTLKTFAEVAERIATAFGRIGTIIGAVVRDIRDIASGELPERRGRFGEALGFKQTGGFIPHTGLYKLHAGESVNQAGDTFSSSPTINVFGASNADLISQISEAVTRDLSSLARR